MLLETKLIGRLIPPSPSVYGCADPRDPRHVAPSRHNESLQRHRRVPFTMRIALVGRVYIVF